jgi:hypothetical protein
MMDETVLAAVAAAVASQTVEGLTDACRAAFTTLMRLVRDKVADLPSSAAVLAAAQAEPSDPERLGALRAELQRAVAGSPQFADALACQWRQVSPVSQASGGGVVNTVTGDVGGPVVQARDIGGGVSFAAGTASHGEPDS